jgi:glutamyl-tRNA synthetase
MEQPIGSNDLIKMRPAPRALSPQLRHNARFSRVFIMVRTRFAPSPTGYLHIGGARTALYSWAYARKHGGQFILRIEDTDLDRSTEASVQAILDGMKWLGLDWDEGPIRQTDRLARYRALADQLIAGGHAYWCYASKQDLDQMREGQRGRGEKPRYDGRWRPERAKALGLKPPSGVQPVLRFRNPGDGLVTWDDLVKGPVTIANAELDDLVILRADGVPTYNFGVVVDDVDMRMTHVIRGDDHVNNTPRQINIFRALGAELPWFGHVPMILGPDGERLSKRHGAVSVMQYDEDGYLPEAMINYLARLGWSHGNDEIFSVRQFVEWFDLANISRSPAQFNPEKLAWINNHYLKESDPARLAGELEKRVTKEGGVTAGGPDPAEVAVLLRDRVNTLNELAHAAMLFYGASPSSAELLASHVIAELQPAIADIRAGLGGLSEWSAAAIGAVVDQVLKARGLKMSKLAPAIRAIVFGRTQTPALNQVLALAGRKRVLDALAGQGGG